MDKKVKLYGEGNVFSVEIAEVEALREGIFDKQRYRRQCERLLARRDRQGVQGNATIMNDG
jgi:hypothetical protein